MAIELDDGCSALDIHREVRCGAASALEIITKLADRVAELNPALNAIVGFDSAAAFEEARRVDRSIASGNVGPLAGVPFTVKDCLWVEGKRATQGSLLFRDLIAPRDAIAVERLRTAGAAFIGMTNCSEFACKGVTDDLMYGITRNPWNLERTSGGSSGGVASAVAAGLSPLTVCTDSGGSTRRPAAMTGVVGMNPSAGLVPHAAGFEEPALGNGVIGPMARTVADVEAMLKVIAGADARDPSSSGMGEAAARLGSNSPAKAPRIACSERLGLERAIDLAVAAAVGGAVEKLRKAGMTIGDADPKWPPGSNEAALMPLQQAGLAALYGSRFRQEPDLFAPDIAVQIEAGLRLSGADVARALLLREQVTRSLATFFAELDTPAVPNGAGDGLAGRRTWTGRDRRPDRFNAGARGLHACCQSRRRSGLFRPLRDGGWRASGGLADCRVSAGGRPRPFGRTADRRDLGRDADVAGRLAKGGSR